MKILNIKLLPVAAAITLSLFSCKGKDKPANEGDTTVITTPTEVASTPAPVQVSPDDSLAISTKDAVKDYPNVNATVNNGEITLTGEISRDKLPKLLQAVNATHPKKVNNRLTIK